MKAMILAAGLGQRMQSLTIHKPKPLLLVKDKPLIVHNILSLAKHGFHDIVINLHYQAQKIIDYLGNGQQFGVNLYYSIENELLGTGGGVKQALKFLGNQPFLLISADIYTDFNFAKLKNLPIQAAHLIMVDNPIYNPTGDFALINNQITLDPTDKLTFASISIFQPKLFSSIELDIFPLVTPALRQAIALNQVSGEKYIGLYHNIGTPELLAVANAL